MDGICMRIGWQSIKERFIVFGNRKAIYTQREHINTLYTVYNVHSFGSWNFVPSQKFLRRCRRSDATYLLSLLFVYLFASLLTCSQLWSHTLYHFFSLLLSLFFYSPCALHHMSYCSEFARDRKSDFFLFFFVLLKIYITHAHTHTKQRLKCYHLFIFRTLYEDCLFKFGQQFIWTRITDFVHI